jgi:hypothetical protein
MAGSGLPRSRQGRNRYQYSVTSRVVSGAVARAMSSVISTPTAPNTSRSACRQHGSESINRPSMSKMAARNIGGAVRS